MNSSNIVAEVGLTYKTTVPVDGMQRITSPDAAYELLKSLFDKDTIQLQEQFIIVLLDPNKRCLGYTTISKGGATSTIVDPKFIFQTALLANSDGILLAHNHPSSNSELKASTADINLTKRLDKSAKLLGMQIVDHIILSSTGYLSMKNKGLL